MMALMQHFLTVIFGKGVSKMGGFALTLKLKVLWL